MKQGQWIRRAKKGFNIIFIHGINSSKECWRHKNGSYWPDLLKDESELADIGIYVFSYRTGINTGFYSLSDIVDSLREYFILDDLISSSGLIFVCHSMGGIVIRRFLVKEQSVLIQRGLNKIGLFLVASPSLGSEYANMLSLISSAMGHTQASALQFSQSNVWLNDLDKDFMNLKANENLKIKGKELIEDLPLYGKGFIRKQIVEPFSGAKYFGNSFKVPGSDHSTIATPADKEAIQHRLLVQFVKEFPLLHELNERQDSDTIKSPTQTVEKTSSEVSEHDTKIFQQGNNLLSEEDLNFILDDLSGDHSYYRFQMDKVREYIRYFQKIENYFLCKKIDCLREELIISLKNLDNFLALKFFVYPENQTMDNIRFCLQPDLNIDRAGEPSEYTFTEYEKLTKALESRCNEVYEKYKEYRLQVKRMLMI